MIDFWFLQDVQEYYSTPKAQKAVAIVPGQHTTVRWTLLIGSCLNLAALCKEANNHKNLDWFNYFSKEQIFIPIKPP